MAEPDTFRFSIWHLAQDKVRWVSSNIIATTAKRALENQVVKQRRSMTEGLYFVCDPGHNPDAGSYGPTLWWVTSSRAILPITGITEYPHEGGIQLNVERETIEI